MGDLLYRISLYETKGYWLDRFEELKEKHQIDMELINVGEETFIDVEKLFSVIDELLIKLDEKEQEIEDLENYYKEK